MGFKNIYLIYNLVPEENRNFDLANLTKFHFMYLY